MSGIKEHLNPNIYIKYKVNWRATSQTYQMNINLVKNQDAFR